MYTVEDIRTLAGFLENVRKEIVYGYDFEGSREEKLNAYDKLVKIDRLIHNCAKFMYEEIYDRED